MRFTRVGDTIEVGRDPVIIKGKNYVQVRLSPVLPTRKCILLIRLTISVFRLRDTSSIALSLSRHSSALLYVYL